MVQRNELLRTIEITTNSFAYQAEALVKLIARGATYKHCYVSIQEHDGSGLSSVVGRNLLYEVAQNGLRNGIESVHADQLTKQLPPGMFTTLHASELPAAKWRIYARLCAKTMAAMFVRGLIYRTCSTR